MIRCRVISPSRVAPVFIEEVRITHRQWQECGRTMNIFLLLCEIQQPKWSRHLVDFIDFILDFTGPAQTSTVADHPPHHYCCVALHRSWSVNISTLTYPCRELFVHHSDDFLIFPQKTCGIWLKLSLKRYEYLVKTELKNVLKSRINKPNESVMSNSLISIQLNVTGGQDVLWPDSQLRGFYWRLNQLSNDGLSALWLRMPIPPNNTACHLTPTRTPKTYSLLTWSISFIWSLALQSVKVTRWLSDILFRH